jgi:hypothetical protein
MIICKSLQKLDLVSMTVTSVSMELAEKQRMRMGGIISVPVHQRKLDFFVKRVSETGIFF